MAMLCVATNKVSADLLSAGDVLYNVSADHPIKDDVGTGKKKKASLNEDILFVDETFFFIHGLQLSRTQS